MRVPGASMSTLRNTTLRRWYDKVEAATDCSRAHLLIAELAEAPECSDASVRERPRLEEILTNLA